MPLSQVGVMLSRIYADFDSRNYGFSKLHKLIDYTKAFETKYEQFENGGKEPRYPQQGVNGWRRSWSGSLPHTIPLLRAGSRGPGRDAAFSAGKHGCVHAGKPCGAFHRIVVDRKQQPYPCADGLAQPVPGMELDGRPRRRQKQTCFPWLCGGPGGDGLVHVAPVFPEIFSLETLWVEGHEKRGKYVPCHLHLNVTYLAGSRRGDALRQSLDENSGVRWFMLDEAVRPPPRNGCAPACTKS